LTGFAAGRAGRVVNRVILSEGRLSFQKSSKLFRKDNLHSRRIHEESELTAPGQHQDNDYNSKKCCDDKAALSFVVVEE